MKQLLKNKLSHKALALAWLIVALGPLAAKGKQPGLQLAMAQGPEQNKNSLPAPHEVQALSGNGQVTLSWQIASRGKGSVFNVYRSRSREKGYKMLAKKLRPKRYIDNKLTDNSSYHFYRLRSVSPKGRISAPSKIVAGAGGPVRPSAYLRSRIKPRFKSDHRLIPLSLAPGWANSMPFAVSKELAEDWGFGLLFGRLTKRNVKKAKHDKGSVYYKVLKLAKSTPKKYPLDVILNTQNYFKGEKHATSRKKTPKAYLRNKEGNFVKNRPIASPETPDRVWEMVVRDLTYPLEALAKEGVAFNTIQHWSEWFLPVWGWGKKAYPKDPRVVAAKKAMAAKGFGKGADLPLYSDWNKYIHTRRAYYEGKLAKRIKAVAPNRKSYNWYGLCGGTSYFRFGGYASWQYFQFGVGGAEAIADYPGASLYRPDNGKILNSGGTDNQINDILSGALAAKAVEIAHGVPLNQSWVWVREDLFSIFPQYIGFVKCLYVMGQVGHIHFLFPEGAVHKKNYSYDKSIDPNKPPTWLLQVEALARIYATFTHLDHFIYEGRLLEGPHKHIFWEQRHLKSRLPGYVLDNPYELFRDTGGSFRNSRPGKVRVVARQKKDGELLLCVWAADGQSRKVPVTLPDGKTIKLRATADGTLYRGFGQKLKVIRNF